MRVIGGTARSIRLRAPKGIRPTTDAMRETLFNVLGAQVEGARFLDMFAGSGAVGIEALSRGAAHCTFVDRCDICLDFLRENLERAGATNRAEVVQRDAIVALGAMPAPGEHHLAFADAPYQFERLREVLELLLEKRHGLAEGAVLVVQHQKGNRDVRAFKPTRRKEFGGSVLSFFEEVP